MNLGQMIKEVRRGLDEPTPDFWTDDEITDWLNEAAKLMTSGAQPIQAFFQFTSVQGQQEYILPPDLDELFNVTHFRNTLTPLQVTTAAAAQFGNQITGTPSQFYMRSIAAQTAGMGANGDISLGALQATFSKVIGLNPIPSASGDTITVFYFSTHFTMVALTDTSPIDVAFHRGLISYATAMGKQKDEAYGEMDRNLDMFGKFTIALQKKTINAGQETAFPKLQVLGEDYGYYPSTVLFIPDGAAS